MPLHEEELCEVEVVHHFVLAPRPNDMDGIDINVSDKERHGTTG